MSVPYIFHMEATSLASNHITVTNPCGSWVGTDLHSLAFTKDIMKYV